jgi:hypothetical protein
MARYTEAAQERIYMNYVRDLKRQLGDRNVHPKPFSEVLRNA